MGNSIEEDITKIKQRIEDVKEYIEYGLPYSEYLDLENSFDNILSDYERVLKENEELKQDRNNNYQMMALAQNEVLGYMQGYEDGKKLKRSAVANIVENQQYYTMRKEIEHYKECIEKLQKENEKLKNIRYDTPYGTETIHLIPESDLIEINTQKYMIEVEPGKFVDLKQVYLENKELKSRIPSLENGTYTGDIEGLLKLEKEIVKRDNEIKQLKEEVSQYKKIKEISENITLEDVEKAAENYVKDYILREKIKEIAHKLYYNNYKGNLDDGKFAQEMAEELEKALREEQEETMKEGEE